MKTAICLNEKNYDYIKDVISGDKLSITEFLFQGSSYDLVFLDSNTKNLEGILENIRYAHCKVILWGVDIDANELRNYFKKNLIFDYIDSDSYYNILGVLREVEESLKKDILSLKDSNQEIFISIDNLNYITYDRVTRKAILNCKDKNVSLTKKLSELEFFLSKYGNFIKADRSTIVNMKQIESINYKDESVSFINGEIINLSKNKLKELSEYVSLAN